MEPPSPIPSSTAAATANEQEASDTLAQLKSPLKIDNDLRGRHRFYRHRKMSFPAVSLSSNPRGPLAFHQNLHFPATLNESKELISDLEIANRRYRRFSNVSDAVSRKLSTTIGWRTVSVQDIVSQSKSICSQFIRMRLKRNVVANKRLGLQRIRSMMSLQAGSAMSQAAVGEVFAQLHLIGLELERIHPNLYVDVSRQVAVTITNEKSVSTVLSSIGRNLLKTDVTWGKIASLYCVAGGLAIDCVQQGHPEYLYGIVETMGFVIERDAATWIAQQGGWAAMLSRFRPPNDDTGAFQMIALSVICLILLLMGFIFILRTIGKFAFSPSSISYETVI